MLELFGPVRGLLEEEAIRTDNFAFRLHSRVTVLLLLICTILVTAKQYFGEPISCITDSSIDKDPVNAYCWVYGTFTVSRHLSGIPGRNVASAGVGNLSEEDQKHHHRYYQWVCFALSLQAFLFYAPGLLWRSWEKGTAAFLARLFISPDSPEVLLWTEEKRRRLMDYLSPSNIHARDFYAYRYVFCEFLNFLNTVGQMYALDTFLQGEFRGYGSAVITFALQPESPGRTDPMARLFPKLTKCTIHTFGSAGSPQTHDALCVLPLNVVNEKIFLFLWFWFLLLTGIGALAIVYRFILLSQPRARAYLLRAAGQPRLSPVVADRLVRIFSYERWFLLYQLAPPNSSPILYGQLLDQLANLFSLSESKNPESA